MEQPTLFYAIALTLALMDFGGGINYWLAWGYVGFRIIHSIVQATINVVPIRFTIFLALPSFARLRRDASTPNDEASSKRPLFASSS